MCHHIKQLFYKLKPDSAKFNAYTLTGILTTGAPGWGPDVLLRSRPARARHGLRQCLRFPGAARMVRVRPAGGGLLRHAAHALTAGDGPGGLRFHAVVVGASRRASRWPTRIERSRCTGKRLLGFFDDRQPERHAGVGIDCLGASVSWPTCPAIGEM